MQEVLSVVNERADELLIAFKLKFRWAAVSKAAAVCFTDETSASSDRSTNNGSDMADKMATIEMVIIISIKVKPLRVRGL